MSFTEQRAKDSLSFDPLPPSGFVSVSADCITIHTRYSEVLSHLLRNLPGSRWDRDKRLWRYPFTSADAIREKLPEIERLASIARDAAEKETDRRDRERERAAAERAEQRAERERQRAAARPRPFMQQFLNSTPDRPTFALTLEAIGDNLRQFGMPSRDWVARLFGSNGRGGWARVFVSGVRDYTSANSQGSRGVKTTYFLEEGPIYEVSSPISWKSTDRYFLRIANGTPQRLNLSEVEQCLER